MAKETAEQKLLKLIEATNAQQSAAAPATAPAAAPAPAVSASQREAQKVFQSVAGVGVSTVTIPPFVNQILSFFTGFIGVKGQGFGLREFNRLFILGVFLFGIFFSLDLMKSVNKSKADLRFVLSGHRSSKEGAQGAVWAPKIKSFEEYVQVFSKRSLFQPYEEKVVKKIEQTSEEKSGIQRITDQVKDLKLVGISWLDSPETASAMIENTSSGTTYFLGVGDRIQNVTVKKIYADGIVIGFESEEMEIKL